MWVAPFFSEYKLLSSIILSQHATGTVTASWKPSKIIIYKGWVGGVEMTVLMAGRSMLNIPVYLHCLFILDSQKQ